MTTEPLLLRGQTILDCWRVASEVLARDGDRANLILHIELPASFDEAALRTYDPRKFKSGIRQSSRDVANTIFPAPSAFHSKSIDDFCIHYTAVYRRGASRSPHAWGTYFQRLVSFGSTGENQLARIVDAMTNWHIRPRAAFVVHLSSPTLDRPKPQGAPCWQYAQFIRSGESMLSLTAAYRSHDYFQKALGNLAGLRRLLQFVCAQAKMEIGTLTCLSTFATLRGERHAMLEMLKSWP